MKQFHSFRLDPVNHSLWRGTDRVPLTPKAFDLLRYLVDHPERLVTQDEILEALWTDAYVNAEVSRSTSWPSGRPWATGLASRSTSRRFRGAAIASSLPCATRAPARARKRREASWVEQVHEPN